MATSTPTSTITDPIFGDLIYGYFASHAIADGLSVQLDPKLTREVRLNVPVVLTKAAHDSCVAWDRDEAINDIDARGRDLLLVMRGAAIRAVETNSPQSFTLHRVENRTTSGDLSSDEDGSPVSLVVRPEYFDGTGAPCLVIGFEGGC